MHHPSDGDNRFLRNGGAKLPIYTASNPRGWVICIVTAMRTKNFTSNVLILETIGKTYLYYEFLPYLRTMKKYKRHYCTHIT